MTSYGGPSGMLLVGECQRMDGSWVVAATELWDIENRGGALQYSRAPVTQVTPPSPPPPPAATPAPQPVAAAGDFPSGYFRKTTQFREGNRECLEGNQLGGGVLGGAAFMDSCQNVSGQAWRVLPATIATRLDNPTATDISQQLTGGGIANLAINVDLDSDQLSPQARGVVATLAQAIVRAGLGYATFEIQGHTDASGNPAYNLDLSQRRAVSVLNELSFIHGIRAAMIPVGYGETRRYDRANPGSAVTRRVEVHLR